MNGAKNRREEPGGPEQIADTSLQGTHVGGTGRWLTLETRPRRRSSGKDRQGKTLLTPGKAMKSGVHKTESKTVARSASR